jgi:hypothetical protein
MITLIYTVSQEEKADELEWLRDQKIFPSYQDAYDWVKGVSVVKFGVIVNPEAALSIKLRHKLEMQADYRQR